MDQTKTRGYEGQAEVLVSLSLLLAYSTLKEKEYINYYPCEIVLSDGTTSIGCYSYDFRGKLQEVTPEHLFEANFTSTDRLLNDKSLSTRGKFDKYIRSVTTSIKTVKGK